MQQSMIINLLKSNYQFREEIIFMISIFIKQISQHQTNNLIGYQLNNLKIYIKKNEYQLKDVEIQLVHLYKKTYDIKQNKTQNYSLKSLLNHKFIRINNQYQRYIIDSSFHNHNIFKKYLDKNNQMKIELKFKDMINIQFQHLMYVLESLEESSDVCQNFQNFNEFSMDLTNKIQSFEQLIQIHYKQTFANIKHINKNSINTTEFNQEFNDKQINIPIFFNYFQNLQQIKEKNKQIFLKIKDYLKENQDYKQKIKNENELNVFNLFEYKNEKPNNLQNWQNISAYPQSIEQKYQNYYINKKLKKQKNMNLILANTQMKKEQKKKIQNQTLYSQKFLHKTSKNNQLEKQNKPIKVETFNIQIADKKQSFPGLQPNSKIKNKVLTYSEIYASYQQDQMQRNFLSVKRYQRQNTGIM